MQQQEQSPQIKRVQYWIERLENKASTLLDGLPVEEMSPKHQADIALKCLDYLQRFTSIEKTLQDAAQINENQGLLSALKREARGEQNVSKENAEKQEVKGWDENEWSDEDAEEALEAFWHEKEEAYWREKEYYQEESWDA
jgi:cell fate (sporulation/competence/biofilm development) regulator YmcA (YheA/YmcA/DUF963 family)